MLLASQLLKLLRHQIELLLEKVDLAVLSVNQLLLAAQIDLHGALLLFHQGHRQHVLILPHAPLKLTTVRLEEAWLLLWGAILDQVRHGELTCRWLQIMHHLVSTMVLTSLKPGW